MPRVSIQPSGLTIEVGPNESLAEAAWRQGYRWPTTCWGKADCMVCVALVVDGETSVIPPDAEEIEAIRLRLSRHLRRPQSRLACRLRFCGDGAVVEKKGVRPPPASNTSPETSPETSPQTAAAQSGV